MKKAIALISLAGLLMPSLALACAMPERPMSEDVMMPVTEREWTGRQSKRLIRAASEKRNKDSAGSTRYPRYNGI